MSGFPRWPYRIAVLCVYLLCAAPVAAMLLPLLSTPTESVIELGKLLASDRIGVLWGKTCGIAALTALFATALGAPVGLLLDRPAFRKRTWLRLVLTIPLLLPPHVLAVAWVDLLGQQGILNSFMAWMGLQPHPFPLYTSKGVALVQTLSTFPIPMWCLWNASRQVDPAVSEAARNLGAGPITRFRVLLPTLEPAAATGALVVFVVSLLGFSVPSLFQTPVFAVEVFTSFNSFLDQRQATLSAVPICITGMLALALASRIHRRKRNHASSQSISMHAGPSTYPWGWFAVFPILLFAIALPMAALLWRSWPPSTLLSAWGTGEEEIGTSILLASISATLMLAIALILALAARGAAHAVTWPAALAWLVSGPVFGVGLIQLWNHPGLPGWVYDHFSILILAAMGRNFIFAWLGARQALAWLPRSSVESARNLGASPWFTLRTVTLPALSRPLIALWACLAILVMGEVETTVLVAPPGWVPVSLRIFTIMHYGPSETVSALSLLQAVATAGLLIVAAYFARGAKFTRPTKGGIIAEVKEHSNQRL